MLAIETNKLTKKFKEKTAVNEINLKINEGELFALLGTNGAGKTTTIKMLSTLILPAEGEIKILGLDILKDRQKIKEILNSIAFFVLKKYNKYEKYNKYKLRRSR